jgi:hypothetical protein
MAAPRFDSPSNTVGSAGLCYLKRHLDNPLLIVANAYKKDSSVVTFQYRQYELKELYIATEDVLGITFVSAET